HAHPVAIEPGRGAPRYLQRGETDQRLHLGGQRPAPLEREGHAGARHRRPASVPVTQVPAAGRRCGERNRPLGSASPIRPYSPRSKQPTSSVGPNLFFTARTMRSCECRSPSKCSTTSTRCSSVRGPATEPSLVTCPTRIVVSDRS